MAPDTVCLSANPSMDRRLRVRALKLGEVNRAGTVDALPGGKAAHVAMASRALGLHTVWVGFLSGAIGEECANGLRELGITVVAMPSGSQTRVNLEIIEDSGEVTEVLEPGSAPTPEQQAAMIDHCAKAFHKEWKGGVLAISGSMPAGMQSDFYARIIKAARAAGAKTFLDTSGEWLAQSLEAKPDFVKINASEAKGILKGKGDDRKWLVATLRELIARGANSAAITLGKQGLAWAEGASGPVWFARPPEVKCLSSVGSGDTALAGFAYAAAKALSGADAIRFAAACGAANCLAKLTARISLQDVEALLPQIEVQKLG